MYIHTSLFFGFVVLLGIVPFGVFHFNFENAVYVRRSACRGFGCFIDTHGHQHGVKCPCCGHAALEFDPLPPPWSRANAVCPKCRARERHRMTCLSIGLREVPDTTTEIIHFGPHEQMSVVLDRTFLQKKVDFFQSGYAYKDTEFANVAALDATFTEKFGGAIILHVLEHVPELDVAIGELHRVLRPGGWLYVEVPCTPQGKTRSCLGMSEENKRNHCGQKDHVWNFNCGSFRARVEAVGFDCIVAGNAFSSGLLKRHIGLNGSVALKNHVQYRCTRNA